MRLGIWCLMVAMISISQTGCANDPMFASSARGDLEMARIKLAAEPDLSIEARREYMSIAAFCGHKELVKFWAEQGCKDQGSLGKALFSAAQTCRVDTARTLLNLGADPDFDVGTFSRLTPVRAVLLRAAGVWTNSEAEAPSPGEPRNPLGTIMLLHHAGADMMVMDEVRGGSDVANLQIARARGFGSLVDYYLVARRMQQGTSREERMTSVSQRAAELAIQFAEELASLEEKVTVLEVLRRAREGNPDALRTLAQLYASGERGVPVNEDTAIELWRKAARLNDAESQAELERRGLTW